MMKRVCLAFLAMLAVTLALTPGWAETPSRACLAAIHGAIARHKADAVPGDCWRMGPLHLGMTLDQARTLIGAPDASQTLPVTYRRKPILVTQLLYVYPRNLRNWLRLAPARLADFHPATLRLDFSRDALVAISVGNTAHFATPSCKPSGLGRGFVGRGLDFPYGFHGLTLGAPLSSVEPRFGKFSGGNRTRDFHVYLPVPLLIDGKDTVSGIRVASGAPFEAGGAMPDFQLRLDPRSCYVTGYTLTPGH